MILGTDRGAYRQYFFEVWEKFQQKKTLDPVEAKLWQIIALHPEYHFIFADPERYKERDYPFENGETNPFLHMSLHLGIVEQLEVDLPKGVRHLYHTLLLQLSDPHEVTHLFMQSLVEGLWLAQKNQTSFDNAAYLQRIKDL